MRRLRYSTSIAPQPHKQINPYACEALYNEALQPTARDFGSGLLASLAAAIVGDAPRLNAGR